MPTVIPFQFGVHTFELHKHPQDYTMWLLWDKSGEQSVPVGEFSNAITLATLTDIVTKYVLGE